MRLSFDKVFDECVFSNGRQPHLPQAPFSGGKGRILTVLFSGLGWESDKVHKKTKRGGKKAGQFHGRPGKKSRVAPPEPLAEGMCRGGGCSGGAGAPEAGGKLTNRGAEWGGPRGQGRRPVQQSIHNEKEARFPGFQRSGPQTLSKYESATFQIRNGSFTFMPR